MASDFTPDDAFGLLRSFTRHVQFVRDGLALVTSELERRGPTSEQAELAYLHAIADLWDEVTALRAALAAATAREARPLPEGLATVEALLDYIQSAGVEQPDPIRQRLHAALAAHTERVVRWCYANRPSLESRDEYLARALAARNPQATP